MSSRWRDTLLVLILAVLPAIAYSPAWRAGVLLGPGDGTALHLPLRTEVWRALHRSEVPSWNPSSFSGRPLLAGYRPGAFHPLMAALTPLHPYAAFQLLVLVSLGLAATSGFLYARRLGAEPVGAFVVGLELALGPYVVGHLGDTATVVAVPAVALVLLAVEVHLVRARATSAALVAVAVALLLLAGSPEAVGAGALLLGGRLLLAVLRPGAGGGSGALRVVGATVAGALLAAPQLVPTLVALRGVGPSGSSPVGDTPERLVGITGFVVRAISHSPAPIFALAAVALFRRDRRLRAAGAAVFGLGVLLAARGDFHSAGAVPLAFDLTLALLAGLSLSAQWRQRLHPEGRRLRILSGLIALLAAAGLSVAATFTGPLPAELASPVGLLALGLILYVLLAGSPRGVVAHMFLLPLTAAFLLQPVGRRAWEGALTTVRFEEGTPTRRAIDRAMGPRRREWTFSLARTWPLGKTDDLGWANLATVTGRRNVEGYDSLVPACRRAALDGMRTDGTVTEAFLKTDPGRLELLGVRWVQVPTSTLTAPVDDRGLGDAVNVLLEPPRPKLFALPYTLATEVRVASYLAGAVDVPQGQIVAECVAQLATGRGIWMPIRAGIETAEWAWERPDVREVVRHQRARILESFSMREGFRGHQYLGVLRLPGRFAVVGLRFRAWPRSPPLSIVRVGLRDDTTGRASGVAFASGYLSDEVRLRRAVGTPQVTLFEVRRGVGPAWVVESLRRLPSAERVADFLRSPTRLGIDSRREALAVEEDVAGARLPQASRSSGAVLARAVGGRVVVRARGPGLLVVAEGWDPGWTARVDGAHARVLRVNGDRLGVVLAEGIHRVVFRYRARGLGVGLALALFGAAGLGVAVTRERLRSPTRGGSPHATG